MARGINKVVLVGHLGARPECRRTVDGSAVTTLRLATTESWKDRATGQPQERTEWHRVKLFGALAETADRYLDKGSQIFVEGSLRTEKYTDRSGIERWSTEIITSELLMLGKANRADEQHREPERATAKVEEDPFGDIPF